MRYPRPPAGGFSQVAEATRRSMASNRSKGTRPEIALRKAIWAAGLRGYRANLRSLPGTPDVVFTRRRVAVFVNGCFWHACPHCGRFRYPKQNADYWRQKIEANQARDVETREVLEGVGYRVLVLWECEVKKDVAACVDRVRSALAAPPEDGSSP
ncbi:MAG: very short patch repair endonuclease [Fimbriimonadaceae bacterium]